MNEFKIGDKVEVLDNTSWYDGEVGVIYAVDVNGRYLVGFPNTDREPFVDCELKHYCEDAEPKEEPEEYFEETRDYPSTTMKNLGDIIEHIYSLKDSGAQGIRVDIQSEKRTDKGDFETFYKYYWECDLDE